MRRNTLQRTVAIISTVALLALLPAASSAQQADPQAPSPAFQGSAGQTGAIAPPSAGQPSAFSQPPGSGDADRMWALLIGIGKFTGRTKPNPGSAGDALDMRQLLLRQGWKDDHIRVMTDSAATAPAIREGLAWLAQRCQGKTACVFHYSGHVKQLRSNDGDAEAVDEALWSYNNQFIPDGEVARYLRRLPNAWINISGCEAAGFDDNVAGPRRLFTASSKETEKSYEHPEWKNSIWTGLLVDQGIMQGHADANGDGNVTRAEAFEFASPRSAVITREQSKGPQHPQVIGGEKVQWLVPDLSTALTSRFQGPCVFGLPCHGWVATLLQ